MTLGSLFDGSGGFPLGAVLHGITPLWAAEIEPFAVRVTTKRFPDMLHLGDVSRIDGAAIPPVDIISFGSPCTDLSVAGKRRGIIEGEQSSLFYEAIRIIREMRAATNGRFPRFIIFENVQGAFNSNRGGDFREILNEIAGLAGPCAPVPPAENGRWPYADILVGDGWSVAYRLVDAQHFGLAQRRKRLYLVADFGSERAGDILFEREGVSRDFAPGGGPWQEAPGTAAAGAGETGGAVTAPPIAFACNQRDEVRDLHDIAGAVQAQPGMKQQTYVAAFMAGTGAKAGGIAYSENVSPTLKGVPSGLNQSPCAVVYGISSYYSEAMKSANPHAGIYEAETSRTLDANGGNPACNQGGLAIISPAVYDARGNGDGKTVCTITGDHNGHISDYTALAVAYNCRNHASAPVSSTLQAKSDGGQSLNYINPVLDGYVVRRLTPQECAVLQGFDSGWCAGLETPEPTEADIAYWSEVWETHRRIIGKSQKPKTRNQLVKWLRNPHSDSAEYRLWGNGVSLPIVIMVMHGIVIAANGGFS